jgi:hypothetical protein
MDEFSFSIFGSSTEVERVFSTIFDIWSPKKGQMTIETLEARLNVKVNSELNCLQYYHHLKTKNNVLAMVQYHVADVNFLYRLKQRKNI